MPNVGLSGLQKIEIALVLLLILGSALTIAFGGLENRNSLQISNVSSSISPPYGETSNGTITGYDDNFSNWSIGHADTNVKGQLIKGPQSLLFIGSFALIPSASSISIVENHVINIEAYPILEVRLNVTQGVSYGIRFYDNRTNVWWEGSALDHHAGHGVDVIRINMQQQSVLATGATRQHLDQFQIYVEARSGTAIDFRLNLLQFSFLSESFRPITEGHDYRALYIDMGSMPQGNSSWSLSNIHLDANLVATPGTNFTIFIVNGLSVTTSLFGTYIYNSLNPLYRFTLYPVRPALVFPELLPRSNSSLVLVATSGLFQALTVNSLQFLFSPTQTAPELSPQSIGLMYTYFLFFLFLLPIGIAVLLFREFFNRRSVNRNYAILVLVVGLLCRVALAVVTEHVMDTNVYLLSARAWFQYGNPQGSYGPTLPLTFFLYWIPYAPYALLQNLGFQDPHFFAHSAGIVESVFIRLLPMSGDVLTFIALLHFKPSARSFVFSAFYFLNPLVIFMSSVWGQYASVTMALIVIGTYFLNAKKIGRAGAAFVAAGAIELLGFIPYILVLVATARAKKITTLVGLACLILPILAYSSEANQIFRLVLSITGANGTLPLGRTNQYTLLGSFTELSFVSSLHPLLAAGTVVSLGVVYDSYKQKLDARRVLLYTILSALAFLIFSSLLTAWLWLVPAGILYAIMTEREMLGAFTLILGTATSFLMASNTMSYAYLLFDNAGLTVLPAIEFVRNRLPLFSVMVSLLAIIYALYLHKTVGTAQGTLIRMSIVTLGLYLLFYFWLGVYSV